MQSASLQNSSSIAMLWKDRPDSEHKQAIIRLIVGLIAFSYLVYSVLRDGGISTNDRYTLITAGLFFVCALAIIIWLIENPEICIVRRILGILLDNSAITAALYFHGILGAPLFIVYLWVAFGNGFRFGQLYLAISTICGVSGFFFVSLYSSRFSVDPYISGSLLVGLIVLPLYVALLLRELNKTLTLAESANRAKSDLLATMSHEIRTPLNGLVGITDILSKTQLDERQRHFVGLISKSSEWLMRVITDGLDFSKIEANEFLLMDGPFNLPKSLDELCSFYKGGHKNKDVMFVYNIPDDLPQYVVGDQLRLNQVLGNLISNSIKFTAKGFVSIKAEQLQKSETGCHIRFLVEDSGLGIPQEELNTIFEPFKQTSSGKMQQKGGTGLGLAIADRLVKLMGGKIELESIPAEGSKFFFTLLFPPVPVANKDLTSQIKPSSNTLYWTRTPKILLVEDHEINREVVINQLEGFKCNVSIATNGEEAISEIERAKFDLVLMDCQMPLIDGYEATEQIRELEKGDKNRERVPIVALTAHVTVDDKRKCMECGMDDYLGKPFRSNDLRDKLSIWLKHLTTASDASKKLSNHTTKRKETRSQPIPSKDRILLHDLKNALFVIQATADLILGNKLHPGEADELSERISLAIDKAVIIAENLCRA